MKNGVADLLGQVLRIANDDGHVQTAQYAKEELCKREGIDHKRRAEFRDMGDANLLFQCVFFLLLALFSLYLTCICRYQI